MDYQTAVATAPPGAAHFHLSDLGRLDEEAARAALAWLPAVELARARAGDDEAATRVVRALFWTLVYNLEPRRWDELAQVERVHPGLLRALPIDGARVVEAGAGTGRLTVQLVERARRVIAVEPAAPLRELLGLRVPDAAVLDGWAEAMPVPDGWADVVVSCASLAPDPKVITELTRCTRAGGTLAFISPENPPWFESHGFRRLTFDPAEVEIPPHDSALEAFFGPLSPPHELLLTTV